MNRFKEWLKLNENPSIGVTPMVAGSQKDPSHFINDFQRSKFGTNTASFNQWKQQSNGVLNAKDISDLGYNPQSLVRSGVVSASPGNNFKISAVAPNLKPPTSSPAAATLPTSTITSPTNTSTNPASTSTVTQGQNKKLFSF